MIIKTFTGTGFHVFCTRHLDRSFNRIGFYIIIRSQSFLRLSLSYFQRHINKHFMYHKSSNNMSRICWLWAFAKLCMIINNLSPRSQIFKIIAQSRTQTLVVFPRVEFWPLLYSKSQKLINDNISLQQEWFFYSRKKSIKIIENMSKVHKLGK